MSTLLIIQHLVGHKPTKCDSDNQHCYIYIYIYTNSPAQAGYDTRSIFKRSLTGLISEFSFSLTSCPTKAEEPSLPYNLPIAGGGIIGFIPYPNGISGM